MAVVQFRVDDTLKTQAASIYESLGIDLSAALRMFMKRSVMVNGIPFSMVLDNDYDAGKAINAMERCNASAKANGTADLTLEEINAEIAAYRKEQRTAI